MDINCRHRIEIVALLEIRYHTRDDMQLMHATRYSIDISVVDSR